jgi:hypothetical protein
MIDYQQRNRDHLSAFSPLLSDLTHAAWRRQFCDLMLASDLGYEPGSNSALTLA